MSENKIIKRASTSLKEKWQYGIAFTVITTMLIVAGFPLFLVAFFGAFAYFIWKTLGQPVPPKTRDVFEFYLHANEILADTGRRWFGFEIQEVIAKGEKILNSMGGAPPLAYFAVGALYHKAGDHRAAVQHLSYIVENEVSGEEHYAFATPELKNYVRVLRKIEREPAEAPQLSAAIKALESARHNRAKLLLEKSRAALKTSAGGDSILLDGERDVSSNFDHMDAERPSNFASHKDYLDLTDSQIDCAVASGEVDSEHSSALEDNKKRASRKPISEVLRDIYDDA